MPTPIAAYIRKINLLTAEIDALYHRAARQLNLTDSTLRVLYMLHESGDVCMLADIYKRSGVSRQTINSAIRSLEQRGIVCLTQAGGKRKRVCVTPDGRAFVRSAIDPLFRAERDAYASWTPAEIDDYVRLTEKYTEAFRAQLETLHPDPSFDEQEAQKHEPAAQ